MFFDMEGDPLFDCGPEYLFGIVTVDDGVERLKDFWAHDREEERDAFQQAIDFMIDRLRRFPDAHIYHYAAYEETALKRLAMLHGAREREVETSCGGTASSTFTAWCARPSGLRSPHIQLKHGEVLPRRGACW